MHEADPVITALIGLLPPGGRLFDIGANVGIVSCALAPYAGSVVAVEPSGIAFEHLVRAAPDNVRPVCALVGARTERRVFLETPHATETSTSVPFGEHRPKGHDYFVEQVMETTTVDQLAAEYGRPDVIKIDVEGGEPEVLAGATQTLASGVVVVAEFNAHCLMNFARRNPRDVIEEILASFQTVERVAPDGSLQRVTDPYFFLSEHVMFRGCVDNLVCRQVPSGLS